MSGWRQTISKIQLILSGNHSGLILIIYLSALIARFLHPASVILTSLLTISGLLALALYCDRKGAHRSINAFMVFMVLSFLLSSYWVGRTERIIHVLLFMAMNFGVALLLLKSRVNGRAVSVIFYGLSAYFIFLIIRGMDPNEAIASVSCNGVSELLIPVCCLLYIIKSKEGDDISLAPAFLTVLICIWAVGRSGIMASMALFFCLLFLKGKVSVRAFFVFLGACLVYLYYPGFLSILGENIAFLRPAIEHANLRVSQGWDPRLGYWTLYIKNLDFSEMIFGINNFYYNNITHNFQLMNFHNMFISLHAQVGLFLFFAAGLATLALRYFYKYDKLNLILFCVIISRGLTDDYMFFESRDFLFYYFLFSYLIRQKEKSFSPGLSR